MRLIAILILTVSGFFAQAEIRGARRSDPKENVSWNLADWMAQKQKFTLMDEWLAVNKQKKVFEFILDGGQINYDLSTGASTSKNKIAHYSAAFYFSIFGIEGGIENSNEDRDSTFGQLNLRLLGQSSQTTSVTAGYGAISIHDKVNNHKFTNQYGHLTFQLYLFNFLGFDGAYRKYLGAQDEVNTDYDGERIEYGTFVEFGFVRLYGKSFVDRNYTRTSAGIVKNELRDGVNFGARLFF